MMDKTKLNKIFISVVAAAEVLTLFPVIFFVIVSATDSVDAFKLKASASPLIIMGFAMIYMFTVLFCAFKAIQNIAQGAKAYLFLLIPLALLFSGYFLNRIST